MPSTGDVITGGVTGSTVTGAGWPGSSGGIFDVPNGSTPSSGGPGAGEAGWDFLTVGIPNCVLPNMSAISTPSFYLSLSTGGAAPAPVYRNRWAAAGPPRRRRARTRQNA